MNAIHQYPFCDGEKSTELGYAVTVRSDTEKVPAEDT